LVIWGQNIGHLGSKHWLFGVKTLAVYWHYIRHLSVQMVEIMAYTPELSMQSSMALRHMAWALGLPMTETIERVFVHLASSLDKVRICEACQDRRCQECLFGQDQTKN
jgi:hypothetical protein